MGTFQAAERKIWQVATGSNHPNYRQALWRPTRQPLATVTLSETFQGNPEASSWNRRTWNELGVLCVNDGTFETMMADANVDPALAFRMGNMLVVGKLEDQMDFGFMVDDHDGHVELAHGMRLGPGDTQFGIGVIASNGQFITPGPESLRTLEPVVLEDAMLPGSPFSKMNFS